MKRIMMLFVLLFASGCAAQTYKAYSGLETYLGNLSVCHLPGCNPGGSGSPSSTSATVVTSTPCGSGSALKLSFTGSPFTNVLWIFKLPAMTNASHFELGWQVCFDGTLSNIAQLETDIANFVAGTPGTEYMFGGQCDFRDGYYDIWNQANLQWIQTGVPCPASNFTPGTWYSFSRKVHTDPAKALWFDRLIIKNSTYGFSSLGKYSAGALPAGWSSVYIPGQFQCNTGASGGTCTVYYRHINAVAWQ